MELEKIGESLTHIAQLEEDVSSLLREHEGEHGDSSADLELMNLHGNRLRSLEGLATVLPSDFLTTLVELNLSSNLIASSDLPELALLPSLRILDLSGNRLTSINKLPSLQSLLSLSVAFNALDSLVGVRKCPNLVHLDCHGNRIPDANSCVEIEVLGALEELWFISSDDGRSANPICSRPSDIIQIFDRFRFYGNIDGRGRSSWCLEAPPAVPAVSITPRFDRILNKQYTQQHVFLPTVSENSSFGVSGRNNSAPLDSSTGANKGFKLFRAMTITTQSLMRRVLYSWRCAAMALTRAAEAAKHAQDIERIECVHADLRIVEEGKHKELVNEVERLKELLEKQQVLCDENARAAVQAEQAASIQLARERERVEEFRTQLVHQMSTSKAQAADIMRLDESLSLLQLERTELVTAIERCRVELQNQTSVVEVLREQVEIERASRITAEATATQLEERSRSDKTSLLAIELRCSDLESQLRYSEARFRELSEGNEQSVLDALRQIERDLLDAKSASKEDKVTIYDLEAKISRLLEAKDTLEKENAELRTAITSNASDKETSRRHATEMQLAIDEQKSSMEQMCIVIDDLKLALKKIYDRCKQLEAQRAELREANKNLSEKMASISVKQKSEEENNLRAIESIRLEYEKTIVDLVVKCKEAKDQLAAAESRYVNAPLMSPLQNSSISAAEREDFEHRIRVQERMLEDQALAMKEIKQKYEERLEQARHRRDELEDSLSNAQRAMEDLRNEVAANVKVEKHLRKLLKKASGEKEVDDSSRRGRSRSRSSERNTQTSEDFHKEITSLQQALIQKNMHLEAAQSELSNLANALDTFRAQIASLQKERDVASCELSELRSQFDSKISEKESELSLIRAKWSTAASEAEALRLASLSASRMAEQLRSCIAEKEAELSRANDSLKKFRDTINALAQTSN